MRCGRYWRYASELGTARTSNPRSSSRRISSSILVWRATRALGELAVQVQPRRLQPPARHLGDEIAGLTEAGDEDLNHLEEEGRRGAGADLDELPETFPVEVEKERVGLGLDGRGARCLIEQAHLSEELAPAHPRQHLLHAAQDGLGDHDGPVADQKHLVPLVPFAEEHLALLERALPEPQGERREMGLGKILEDGDGS